MATPRAGQNRPGSNLSTANSAASELTGRMVDARKLAPSSERRPTSAPVTLMAVPVVKTVGNISAVIVISPAFFPFPRARFLKILRECRPFYL